LNPKVLEALSALLPVIGTIERIRRDQKRKWKKTAEMSQRLDRYVGTCMKRYRDPGYCWRVAWSIMCSHVNPNYPGCTKYGKRWGKPYSKPISLSGYETQVAPKLHTSDCRAERGGWNPSWTTVNTASTKVAANAYLDSLKKRYRGDQCVRFRIKKIE
jgi:hypothetical protein